MASGAGEAPNHGANGYDRAGAQLPAFDAGSGRLHIARIVRSAVKAPPVISFAREGELFPAVRRPGWALRLHATLCLGRGCVRGTPSIQRGGGSKSPRIIHKGTAWRFTVSHAVRFNATAPAACEMGSFQT